MQRGQFPHDRQSVSLCLEHISKPNCLQILIPDDKWNSVWYKHDGHDGLWWSSQGSIEIGFEVSLISEAVKWLIDVVGSLPGKCLSMRRNLWATHLRVASASNAPLTARELPADGLHKHPSHTHLQERRLHKIIVSMSLVCVCQREQCLCVSVCVCVLPLTCHTRVWLGCYVFI